MNKKPLEDFGHLRRRLRARWYYRETIERRRQLAREGKERRVWARWLIREVLRELNSGGPS